MLHIDAKISDDRLQELISKCGPSSKMWLKEMSDAKAVLYFEFDVDVMGLSKIYEINITYKVDSVEIKLKDHEDEINKSKHRMV